MEEKVIVTVATYTNLFEAELAKELIGGFWFHPNLLNERMMVCTLATTLLEICTKLNYKFRKVKNEKRKRIDNSLEDSDYVTRILQSEGALLDGHFQLTSGKRNVSISKK